MCGRSLVEMFLDLLSPDGCSNLSIRPEMDLQEQELTGFLN